MANEELEKLKHQQYVAEQNLNKYVRIGWKSAQAVCTILRSSNN